MKRWRFAILAAVLVATLGNTDPDDACVRNTLGNYGNEFKDFQKQFDALTLRLQSAAPNLTDASAIKPTENEKHNREFNFLPAVPQVSDIFGLPYVDGQRIRTSFEHSKDEFINVVSYKANCDMPPYEIVKDNILGYPLPLPPYCKTPPYNPNGAPGPTPRSAVELELSAVKKVIEFAKSVGRLQVQSTYKVRSTDNDGKETQVELWGTGFMVGKKTFATSCHVIAPLLKKDDNGNPALNLDKNEKLVVNFTPTDAPPNAQDDFTVAKLSTCSSHDGLDIALLEIDPGGRPLPRPLPLFLGTIRDLAKAYETKGKDDFWRISVLIGYGDLLHPIDETTREMYQSYEKLKEVKNDVKVAMLDGIITEDKCDDDLGIILDTVDTTVGESGSIVMDSLNWLSQDKPAFVLGVHTCCSAYFGLAQYTTLQPDLRCARLNRTFHNQDISSRSILRDRALCPIIRDDYGQMVDDKGNTTAVTCYDLRWEWPLSWKTFYK